MLRNYKLYIGLGKPHEDEKGWLHIDEFSIFCYVLDTYDLSNIDLIKFGTELSAAEDSTVEDMTLYDCAVELVSVARGRKLPQCFLSENQQNIENLLNHYTSSYQYDNYCAVIETV